MAHGVSIAGPAAGPRVEGRAIPLTAAIPWYIWCGAFSILLGMVGAHWDFSWHTSIGRDTFWTPAHVAIYASSLLGALWAGYLILGTTFGGVPDVADSSVRVWGFRGPLGAFLVAWGGIALLASAPFDDWWHNAYGLDVKILSPPHVVGILGALAGQIGTLLLILSAMNRASGVARRALEWLFLFSGAIILIGLFFATLEYTWRTFMHSSVFYRAVCIVTPVVLAGMYRASGYRWASTAVAGIYMLFRAALVWILPLFPAEPKLGPVYQRVTHFIPPEFPLLLIVPALALDLLWPKIARWNRWAQSAAAGAVFLAVFAAVQWPFAYFLMSPLAWNRFLGAHYFPYQAGPTSFNVRRLFLPWDKTPEQFWLGMGFALIVAMVSTRAGIAWGDWMRRIRR